MVYLWSVFFFLLSRDIHLICGFFTRPKPFALHIQRFALFFCPFQHTKSNSKANVLGLFYRISVAHWPNTDYIHRVVGGTKQNNLSFLSFYPFLFYGIKKKKQVCTHITFTHKKKCNQFLGAFHCLSVHSHEKMRVIFVEFFFLLLCLYLKSSLKHHPSSKSFTWIIDRGVLSISKMIACTPIIFQKKKKTNKYEKNEKKKELWMSVKYPMESVSLKEMFMNETNESIGDWIYSVVVVNVVNVC